jgi:hypothetical protein
MSLKSSPSCTNAASLDIGMIGKARLSPPRSGMILGRSFKAGGEGENQHSFVA